MRRWLPYPLLWVLLIGFWLLLNESLAAGQAILGALIALGAVHGLRLLQAPQTRLRRPGVMAALAAIVVIDIVQSSIAVARILMHVGVRRRTAGFVNIPLELRNPAALAILAAIITSTPGTLWARYDSSRSILTIHVLDLTDEETWIRTIKDRYERRLLEIFQ